MVFTFATVLVGGLLSLSTNLQAQNAKQGQQKAANCNTCHGADGIAKMPQTPHLAGQPSDYLAQQLKLYRNGKRQHEIMGIMAKPLTDQDIEDLAAWYASMELTVKVPGQ